MGYLSYYQKHNGPQSQLPASGAGNLTFLPANLPQDMDSLVAHVAGLTLTIQGTIVQAANSPAVSPTDWDLLIAQPTSPGYAQNVGVLLQSQGKQPVQASYMACRRIMDSVTFAGFTGGSGPALPASTPGASTNVTLVYNLDFMPEQWLSPWEWLMPLAWWSPGQWQYQFANPGNALDPHITWASAPTATLGVHLLMSQDIHLAAPWEWREQNNPARTSSNTVLDSGIYRLLGFQSPAFGGQFGCDDLQSKLTLIYPNNDAYRFPSNLSGADYASFQALRKFRNGGMIGGTPFYPGAAGFASVANISAPSAAPATTLASVQLIGPFGHMPQTESAWVEYSIDQNWNWVVNVSTGLSNNQNFYMAKLDNRTGCSDTSLAGATGEVVKKAISGGTTGCGTFGAFVPNIPPGRVAPPPELLSRYPLIARRVG